MSDLEWLVCTSAEHSFEFTTEDFDYFGALAAKVPEDGSLPGVAGFRLNWPLNRPDRMDEVASFVGASYLRALGAGEVYGASARGIALNTWVTAPEEFPRFTRFYLSRNENAATVLASDGASYEVPRTSKDALAHVVWDLTGVRLAAR